MTNTDKKENTMRIDNLENLQALSIEEISEQDNQKQNLQGLTEEELKVVVGGIEIDINDDIFLP